MRRAQLAGHPEYSWVDGYHPSPLGYDVWADVTWPAVRAAVASRPPSARESPPP